MQRLSGDGTLNRMIAELTALDPVDAEAIMQALEPRARHRVLALLDTHKQPDTLHDPAQNTAGIFSDWLSDRIVRQSALTETAHAALRCCAAEVAGTNRPVLPDVAAATPSLLSRLGGALKRSGRRS